MLNEALIENIRLKAILQSFQFFLKTSWEGLPHDLLQSRELEDWYQANWEIIVENAISKNSGYGVFIDVYGDGADCNHSSSRVWFPDKPPTYSIRVNDDFVFHSFGSIKDNVYTQMPPFEYVKGESKNDELVILFKEASFSLGNPYDAM